MVNPLKYISDKFDKLAEKFASKESPPPIQDISLAMARPNPNSINRAVRMRSKALGRALSHEAMEGYATRRGTSAFIKPVHDLAEVARAADVEPYISQSIRKHRELILKEGYSIQGSDDQMVEYIKQRLFDFQMVTDISTDEWIREGITNLVTYHNSSLVVRRDITRSRGRLIKRYNKLLVPIAGIFVLDPTTLAVKVDKHGTTKRWEQCIEGGLGSGSRKTFAPEDVMNITIDKNSGFTFGTPYIVPVLDDVRALRRLEELSLKLASREVFPLYHYQVGTDQQPSQILDNGSDEVSAAVAEVQNMPIGGTLVTSHRHNLTLVSKEGSALDLKPYLEYFEARVMAGLRLSALDLGRGGTTNRACYSGDTETLTDKGWKHYSDIDIERDKIATVNPETHKLEFHKAEAKLVYPYNGVMYRFLGANSDILVTPEHEMWIKEEEWKKVRAQDIDIKCPTVQIAAEWNNTQEEDLDIDIPISCGIIHWTNLIAKFIRYGKIAPSRGEIKFIIRNDSKTVDVIKHILSEADVKFRYYDNESYIKIAINDYGIAKHLTRYCACKQYPKKVPDYITRSKVLSTTFLMCLGSVSDLIDESCILYSRNHTISSQIQEMAIKSGANATVLTDGSRDRIIVSYTTEESVEMTHEAYNGDVYCFNVPNHLFVTRRNGKIAIQGNTATNINKNVLDAAKDYQQAFSTAITFKLFLPLLLEGGFNVTPENLVRLSFPDIDREEMRAQQNHGQQLFLSNTIDCDEFRRDYLGKPPFTEEQEKKTPRALDAEVDEKLTRVAGQYKASSSTSRSTAKNSTSKASKSASNRGQPRNQSGTKSSKTRVKANDYSSEVDSLFLQMRKTVVALIEAGIDEVTNSNFVSEVNKAEDSFKKSCLSLAEKHLPYAVMEGVDLAQEQEEDTQEDIVIGRRAIGRLIRSYVKNSLEICLKPYVDRICRCAKSDEDGNTSLYKAYGTLSSLHSSLRRLVSDHLRTSTRFGFARAAKTMGYTSIQLGTEEGVRKTIDFKGSIMYRNLIPTLKEKDDLKLGSRLIDQEESDV